LVVGNALADSIPVPIARVPDGPPLFTKAADDFEQLVVESVNQERWTNGQLAPLKRVTELDSSSELHSSNMDTRNFFAHCDLDTGTSPSDRAIAAGYGVGAAENIAAGYSTPSAVMTGWMGSTGHRNNILSTSHREIGVGYVLAASDTNNIRVDFNSNCVADTTPPNAGPYYHYWTQNFGARSAVYPVVINREAYTTTTRAVQLYLYGTGWAQDMRFNNDGGSWSAWETFNSNKNWQLSAGNGSKTVNVELRNGSTVGQASDTIMLAEIVDDNMILSDQFE